MKNLILVIACALVAGTLQTQAAPNKAKSLYVCPPCGCAEDNDTFDKPGKCPTCGMKLVEKSKKTDQHTVTVAVLLFDGAEIIDYAGPWEAFGEAGFKIFTVAEKAGPIHATFGQKIIPDYTFANSPSADILLVPGGSVERAIHDSQLLTWLQKNAQASRYVMSVCTGAFVLAHAGLLDGLSATTVSHAIDELGKVSPRIKAVSDQRYVDNGKIITTAGLSSGIDGAFHLIAKIKGQGTAQAVALGMEYRWDPASKFVRAALADMRLPDFSGIEAELLSTEGDSDHWESRALVAKPNSAADILYSLGKQVVTETPHTRGPVTLLPPGSTDSPKTEIEWKFTDEQDHSWRGSGMVVPAADHPGKFYLTLKLVRQTQDQKS